MSPRTEESLCQRFESAVDRLSNAVESMESQGDRAQLDLHFERDQSRIWQLTFWCWFVGCGIAFALSGADWVKLAAYLIAGIVLRALIRAEIDHQRPAHQRKEAADAAAQK